MKRLIPLLLIFALLLAGCIPHFYDDEQVEENKNVAAGLAQGYLEEFRPGAELSGEMSVRKISADLNGKDGLYLTDLVEGSYELGGRSWGFTVNIDTGEIYLEDREEQLSRLCYSLTLEALGLSQEDCELVSHRSGQRVIAMSGEDVYVTVYGVPGSAADIGEYARDMRSKGELYYELEINYSGETGLEELTETRLGSVLWLGGLRVVKDGRQLDWNGSRCAITNAPDSRETSVTTETMDSPEVADDSFETGEVKALELKDGMYFRYYEGGGMEYESEEITLFWRDGGAELVYDHMMGGEHEITRTKVPAEAVEQVMVLLEDAGVDESWNGLPYLDPDFIALDAPTRSITVGYISEDGEEPFVSFSNNKELPDTGWSALRDLREIMLDYA